MTDPLLSNMSTKRSAISVSPTSLSNGRVPEQLLLATILGPLFTRRYRIKLPRFSIALQPNLASPKSSDRQFRTAHPHRERRVLKLGRAPSVRPLSACRLA